MIYPSNLTDAQLSSNELLIKQKISSYPESNTLNLINFSNLQSAQSDGVVSILLNPQHSPYSFNNDYIRTYPNGDYIWHGELTTKSFCSDQVTENECFDGELLLIKKNSSIFGKLRIDTTDYEILSLGENLSVLVKMNSLPTSSSNECWMPQSLDSLLENGTEDRGSACPVRVLVCYTWGALGTWGYVDQTGNLQPGPLLDRIYTAFYETKIAMERSRVFESDLNLILAGVQQLGAFEWFEDGTSIASDVISLTTDQDLINYRNYYQADLVITITTNVYVNEGYGAVAAFGDTPANAVNAYAIVCGGYMKSPNYSFAHEIGHLFGVRHERKEDCANLNEPLPPIADAHGYIWRKGCCTFFKDYRTIMGTWCSSGKRIRIQNYSNPEIEYKNKPTGQWNTNNAASVLRGAACRIASYILAGPVSVTISGDHFYCPGVGVGLQAIVSSDNPILGYSYLWEASFDGGFTWINPQNGSLDSYNILLPDEPGEIVRVRLTVTTNTGQILYAWHHIEATYDLPEPCPRDNTLDDYPYSFDKDVTISPNPNLGVFKLAIKKNFGRACRIKIYNLQGKTELQIKHELNKSFETELIIQGSSLGAGFYFMEISSEKSSQIIKFEVIK